MSGMTERRTVLDQRLTDEIVQRLLAMAPLKIFLFGSQAAGTAGEESDVDLMIVKERVSSPVREAIEARRLLRGLGRAFDLVVATREEFESYGSQMNSVHHAAAHYGRCLYG